MLIWYSYEVPTQRELHVCETAKICSVQNDQALSECEAQRLQRAALERALAEAKAKLEEASATNVRLQRESEYIIANVNRWVAEQK